MQVFDGWLCGGTRNEATGAQVWCTQDGLNWNLKSFGGLGYMMDIVENVAVTSGYVFNRGLYFSVQNVGVNVNNGADDVAVLYRTTDLLGEPTWQEVLRSEAAGGQMTILGEFQGALYVSYQGTQGIRIMRSVSGDPNTWEQVNLDGMNKSPDNRTSSVDGAVIYKDSLYISISNETSGVQLWRTIGQKGEGGSTLTWEAVATDGLGDAANISAQLVVFEGALLAWTTNPRSGQQVRQTVCNLQASDNR